MAAPGSIEEKDYEAAFDRLAGVWNSAAGIAQKAGIRLNWEFEPGFAFNFNKAGFSWGQPCKDAEEGRLAGPGGAVNGQQAFLLPLKFDVQPLGTPGRVEHFGSPDG